MTLAGDRVTQKIDQNHSPINQLIVGPEHWSYQVLRQTFGERFMLKSEASIFIDRSEISNNGIDALIDLYLWWSSIEVSV